MSNAYLELTPWISMGRVAGSNASMRQRVVAAPVNASEQNIKQRRDRYRCDDESPFMNHRFRKSTREAFLTPPELRARAPL
jgi:hypothetical protein